MLIELRIENFAIIDQLILNFEMGFIAFTGETGAGKSIIIDAVETLLGGRADTTFVRAGAEQAYLEAVFRIDDQNREPLREILEREELYDDPNYLTLGREIRMNGRNVARVNGRTVSAGMLRELGEHLIDVHGQSEHLSLLKVNQHLGLLDSYAASLSNDADGAGNLPVMLSEYRNTYRELQAVRRELESIRQSERDAARRTDMLTYQINEIEAARLKPGEEEQLLEERNRLANAEGLAILAQESLLALDEGTPEAQAAMDLLGKVVDNLADLARLDPSQAELHDQSQVIFENLTELSGTLRAYLEGIEFNPKRLDQVEERLDLIRSLQRKYGPDIPVVLEFLENARRQLDDISHAEERLEELEQAQQALMARLGEQGLALSEKRREAAGRLGKAIERELNDLNMSGARFTVGFERRPDPEGLPLPDGSQVAYDATGIEKVEFLIAPNPGEGFKPLAKIASGGETSRLMLALKNVLAQADRIPTLIFDEIDQGIGGRVGTIVGEKLWSLARRHQVLCITHLPQLAAFGEQHYQVRKLVKEGRTTTQVQPLTGEERLRELAQMMGEISEGTLRSARELLRSADRRTAPSNP